MQSFAMHIAAAEGKLKISRDDDLNARVEGFAPIHFAGAYCARSLEMLLDAGADPTLQVKGGIYDSWEAVHFAAYHHNYKSLNLLKERAKVAIERGFRKGFTAKELL